MKPIRRRAITATLLIAVFLISALAAVPAVIAPVETRNFTATISPTKATAGETKSYTIRITNNNDSTKQIKSIKIIIPTGFTGVSITYGNGGFLYSSDGKKWNATIVAGTPSYIDLNKAQPGAELNKNQYLDVPFSATAPSTPGTFEWTTRAWEGDNFGGYEFTLVGEQPKVTVLVSITITSDPAGAGFVKVDGTPITTPYTFNWTPGDTHSLQALSPVADPTDPTGTQYVWTDWSDSGTQTHDYIVPSSAETVKANYKTQYNVTFAQTGLDSNASGTVVMVNGSAKTFSDLPFQQWYDSSDTVNYTYAFIVNSTEEGMQFRLDNVTGPASPITVTEPITVMAYYFSASGYQVGSVVVGTQTGTLTAGTAGSVTYTVTVNRADNSFDAFNASLTITGFLPTGVTFSFDPDTVFFGADEVSNTSTLTITTTSGTPAWTTYFTVRAQNTENEKDYAEGQGTLTVGAVPLPTWPPEPYVPPVNLTEVRGNVETILSLGEAVIAGDDQTLMGLDYNHDGMVDIADAFDQLVDAGLLWTPSFTFDPDAASNTLMALQSVYGANLESFPSVEGRVWLLYMLTYLPYQ
jgi:hypothetical protein